MKARPVATLRTGGATMRQNTAAMTETMIHPLRDDEPVRFAAEELARYMARMDVQAHPAIRASSGGAASESGIRLGLFSDFDMDLPPGDDPLFDDRIYVEIEDLNGVIAGSNPRSVLMGVYRYLESAGCRFVRPGPEGEFLPAADLSRHVVELEDAPSYRHRGVCIEGAVSVENMLENIDWAPKAGLNSYMLEFMVPYTFFDRWYRHLGNPYKTPEPLTVGMVEEFKARMEREIVRRGLAYHTAGHGWTCEPLGIPGLSWDSGDYPVSDEVRPLLAAVNGVRDVYRGIPLNTNLCYSNPEARRRVVEYAVQYVQGHPYITALHIWLADDANNHCECPACRDTLPSDFYVKLLNEMDAAFTARGLGTKLVFIAYLDLLWPPEKQRFANPDRFLLLFAPISRSYSRSYDLETAGIAPPPYVRNQLRFPANIAQNLAYLREWQKLFAGDAFTYEYYFMWDCYFDPGYWEAAKVLNEDVKKLRAIGLNGIVSDQTQRSFFPTGFGMHVMARTLWDSRATVESLAADYFPAAFGADGESTRAYLAEMSRLFDPPYLRGDRSPHPEDADVHVWILQPDASDPNAEAAAKLARIPALIDGFLPVIERNLGDPDPCRARSWALLRLHADLARGLAQAFQHRAQGDAVAARAAWLATADHAQRNEDFLQPDLDVFEFVHTLGRKFPNPDPDGRW
jgi:hypothetical protein